MYKTLLSLLLGILFVAAPALAEVQYHVTPDGEIVADATYGDLDLSGVIESLPEGRSVTFCMNSTSIYGIDWFWELEGVRNGMQVDIVGGNITGTICGSGGWDVTGGTITATSMTMSAQYVGGGSCATPLNLIGSRNPPAPRVWSGTYGWYGSNNDFPHDTEFVNIGPCP